MPASVNWRTKHARKMLTRCGLGAACWLRDGFDLGKRRRRSSTPAVVPGAAPTLAKAGVGGYEALVTQCKSSRSKACIFRSSFFLILFILSHSFSCFWDLFGLELWKHGPLCPSIWEHGRKGVTLPVSASLLKVYSQAKLWDKACSVHQELKNAGAIQTSEEYIINHQ